MTIRDVILAEGRKAENRLALWSSVVSSVGAKTVLEIGIWKGEFSETILTQCPDIAEYYMVDPWRPLETWNKPLNVSSEEFDRVYAQATTRTEFARERRRVLRGKKTEVIDGVEDESIDFLYIDGDHSLRGIAIDLISAYPKVKNGGIIAGDDLTPTIWQHGLKFEPTMVFPFASYFAEAQGHELICLPFLQFAILKTGTGFKFTDLTGLYERTDVLSQIERRPTLSRRIRNRLKRMTGNWTGSGR